VNLGVAQNGLWKMQPILALGDDLFVKTTGAGDGVTLTTAQGVLHRFRRFGPRAILPEHQSRLAAAWIRRNLGVELERHRLKGRSEDVLAYFVDFLWPASQDRDWGIADPASAARELQGFAELDAEVDRLCRGVPPPSWSWPSPSLWVLGRIWMLREVVRRAEAVDRVEWGKAYFELSDEHFAPANLERRWLEEARSYLDRATLQLRDRPGTRADSEAVRTARSELERAGCLVRGDLLLLPGNPPRLGYILPPHWNCVLGRMSRNELAMTAPLTLPPLLVSPGVYARGSDGRWAPYPLPHGLCLGGGLPAERPDSAGLALLTLLRWSAVRVVANGGMFHASDAAFDRDEDDTFDG
jgi:hypothetical protein